VREIFAGMEMEPGGLSDGILLFNLIDGWQSPGSKQTGLKRMEYHLDRKLRLNPDASLSSWAIYETDRQGEKIGDDQIPWDWTAWFTAVRCELLDLLEIESPWSFEDESSAPPALSQKEIIRLTLRPTRLGRGNSLLSEVNISMFGTGRIIEDFRLDIVPSDDRASHAQCTAWGSPAYSIEIAFRKETAEDCINFELSVDRETFQRYASAISAGSVGEIDFGVGRVSGLYSKWSPSAIPTTAIKVLAGDEQKVEIPSETAIEPPRLGRIGHFHLYLKRPYVLDIEQEVERAASTEPPDSEASDQERSATPADPELLRMLTALRQAVWLMVVLLTLLLVVVFLRQ